MTSAADVIAVCNEGTDFIRSGHYDTAIDCLHHGLVILKAIVISGSEVATVSSATTARFQFNFTDDGDPDKLERDVITSDSFVFHKPISIGSQSSGGPLASTEFFSKLSFAVLYNLALAHHLNAQVTQQGSGLARALTLYKTAYKIQMEGRYFTCLECMALLNNMGQIYKDFHDEKASRLCFECLVSNVMLLRDRGWALEEYSVFIASVVPLILTDSCSAGAA